MLDARSKLAIEQTEFDVNMLLADITAKKKALMRDTELQIKLEVQRAFVLTEQFRAEKLSKAIVEAETMKTKADAQSYKLKAEADARLYTERKNAEAVDHVFEAQSKGLAQLNDSFHGDNKAIIKYLFLERGVYKDISVQNSAALQGLCPEIAVWDTQGTVTTAIDKKSLVK